MFEISWKNTIKLSYQVNTGASHALTSHNTRWTLVRKEFTVVFFLLGNSQGLAAVPGREEEFKQCLELSIKYAEAVKCAR